MPLIRKPAANAAPAAPPVATAPVMSLLHSSDPEQRWTAARAAAGNPASAAALGAAIADEPDARVREAMFTSLARIATDASVEQILPYLRADDATLRTAAMDALGAMKALVAPYLPPLLADADADMRLLTCDLCRGVPQELAEDLLCVLLESESQPNVCAAALEVLMEIGGPRTLPVLARCEARFAGTPFLAFSFKVAADRIRAQGGRTGD